MDRACASRSEDGYEWNERRLTLKELCLMLEDIDGWGTEGFQLMKRSLRIGRWP